MPVWAYGPQRIKPPPPGPGIRLELVAPWGRLPRKGALRRPHGPRTMISHCVWLRNVSICGFGVETETKKTGAGPYPPRAVGGTSFGKAGGRACAVRRRGRSRW